MGGKGTWGLVMLDSRPTSCQSDYLKGMAAKTDSKMELGEKEHSRIGRRVERLMRL